MKQLLLFCSFFLLLPLAVLAHASVAYTVYNETTRVLTYYYDDQAGSESRTNAGTVDYQHTDRVSIPTSANPVRIVIASSFASNSSVEHINFSGATELTEIAGLQYLNTSNAKELSFSGCSSLTGINLNGLNLSNLQALSFYGCSSLSGINLSGHNLSNIQSLSFYGCSSLTNINLSGHDLSSLTSMQSMFQNCSSLKTVNMSGVNASNASGMSAMFQGCTSLTSVNMSDVNASSATAMIMMFYQLSNLTSVDLSGMDISNVTNMGNIFHDCSNLTSVNFSGIKMSKVTNMGYMFMGCSKLANLDLSSFNTSSVTSMEYMLMNCTSLTSLDLTGFDTGNVNNMNSMFFGCTALTTIYCNDAWSASSGSGMFTNCTSIVGGHGTTYSATNTSVDFAHPEVGGYFTKKKTTFSTVTIGGTTQYWRTYYTDTRNVKADETTTVYTATLNDAGTNLTIHEIADKIIPAGNAVLLRSTTEEAVLYTADSEGTGDYSTNSLKGTQRDLNVSEVSGTVYTLAQEGGAFGFHKFGGTVLAAGKAYLVVNSASPVRFITFDTDETTSINLKPTTAPAEAELYDLQGRRMEKPSKGIYIVNGKKIVKR